MRITKRKNPLEPPRGQAVNLNAPLLRLSENPKDDWTVEDAMTHTLVVGQTGSGKSSSVGKALAHAFLKNSFGGIVVCAKADEADRWEAYARECGREVSVIRFDASGRWRFNFLDYLMKVPPALGGGLVDNAVHALMHLIQVGQRSGEGGAERNDFWQKAVRELLSNAIAGLYHAWGRVRLDDLLKLVNSVPISEEQAKDPGFQTWSFCFSTMRQLFEAPAVKLPDREAALLINYFGQTLGQRLDAKTRSNILITLSAEISPFLKAPLHTLFCTDTNVTPEVTHEGVVIILDLPIKRFEHTGVVAQMLFKHLWQKAAERREVRDDTRAIFEFIDEAQLYISPADIPFMSTARSARAAAVYMTQSLPSLYAEIGGRNPRDQADAIIACTSTKVFLSNTCCTSNKWAADTIGKAVQRRASRNRARGESTQTSTGRSTNWSTQEGTSSGRNWSSGGGFSYSDPGRVSINHSANSGRNVGSSSSRSQGGGTSVGTSEGTSTTDGEGWSEQMDYVIQPADFANRLRQGGARNGYVVTGILLQANRRFSRTGSCWMPVAFKQK